MLADCFQPRGTALRLSHTHSAALLLSEVVFIQHTHTHKCWCTYTHTQTHTYGQEYGSHYETKGGRAERRAEVFKTSVRSTSVQITASHDFVPQSTTCDKRGGDGRPSHTCIITLTSRVKAQGVFSPGSLTPHVSTSASAKETERVLNLQLIKESSLAYAFFSACHRCPGATFYPLAAVLRFAAM